MTLFFEANKIRKAKEAGLSLMFEEFKSMFNRNIPEGYSLRLREDYHGWFLKSGTDFGYEFDSGWMRQLTSEKELKEAIGIMVKSLEALERETDE